MICFNRNIFTRAEAVFVVTVYIHFLILSTGNVSGQTWFSLGSECYFVGEENVTWDEAKANCQAMGASLLHINSDIEDEFVAELIQTNDYEYWVGARWNHTLSPSVSQVMWTDGSEIAANLWVYYEPNWTGDCVRYYRAENTTRKRLGDHPCTNKYSFICKKISGPLQMGHLIPSSQKTKLRYCPICDAIQARSLVECGVKCLQQSECDAIVYRNKICNVLRLTTDNGCSADSSSWETLYRLNRCST